MIASGALRLAPRLTILLMAGPVAAGLAGTVIPALEDGGVARLLAWPGLGGAVRLSLVTGIGSTLVALVITLGIVAALQGGRLFALILRLLSPLLAVPHAAAALGLAFLVSPSGWISRSLSPWATGWSNPPDLLILNDPAGLALIAGLVIKEVPFLLLILLAALPQADAPRRMMLTQSLGYGRVRGWMLAVLPAVWPQIRPAVYAVLAYSMTAVDMALILGPSLPPTLSAQVVLWMMNPDLPIAPLRRRRRCCSCCWCWRRWPRSGWRSGSSPGWADAWRWGAGGARAGPAGAAAGRGGGASGGGAGGGRDGGAGAVVGGGALALSAQRAAGNADAEHLGPRGTGAGAGGGRDAGAGGVSTLAALILTLACLEAEARFGLRPGTARCGCCGCR
jgi:putative thiamine transport system permease protein